METMKNNGSLPSTLFPDAALVSIGGAYVRIWRPKLGVTAQVPMAAVWSKSRQEYRAIGHEAAQLEEKIGQDEVFTRPYFADEITDRSALQAVLRMALEEDRSHISAAQRFLAPFRYWIHIPPTVSSLHQNWLRQAAWEVGIWPWRARSPLQTVRETEFKQRSSALGPDQNREYLYGVIDVGFSALRVYCGVGQTLLVARRELLGVQSFCEHIVAHQEQKQSVRFPVSVLYDQRWQVKHPIYDLKKNQASLALIPKRDYQEVLYQYVDQVSQVLQEEMERISASQRALLQQHGWRLIGGGAQLQGLAAALEQRMNMPVTVDTYAPYSEFPRV